MKYLLSLIGVIGILLFSQCDYIFKAKKMNTGTMNNNATPNGENTDAMPVMVFEEEDHDFGTIQQGEKINFSFKFINKGGADLIINNCAASCGCTIPNWPRQPISPNEWAYIDVQFDSEGKQNEITKEVTISTNCNPAVKKIKFHGFVKGPAGQ
ncbi:MAG: DUF1573 domain-containing protein [Bacteroidetes bacterium]|nr:DUF1573 domain-containing protein [Bacteroidota bacterium]